MTRVPHPATNSVVRPNPPNRYQTPMSVPAGDERSRATSATTPPTATNLNARSRSEGMVAFHCCCRPQPLPTSMPVPALRKCALSGLGPSPSTATNLNARSRVRCRGIEKARALPQPLPTSMPVPASAGRLGGRRSLPFALNRYQPQCPFAPGDPQWIVNSTAHPQPLPTSVPVPAYLLEPKLEDFLLPSTATNLSARSRRLQIVRCYDERERPSTATNLSARSRRPTRAR